ncbi:glycosyltransferase family 2 protein [Bacteroides stercorirosoris]|jgi:glycosyltransferase involved in cell wall biosynthesis|uniref:Glycosyltransferase n=1 Tax=Bacteroides stercorirosoris TaxID=871324 RepID=A0A413H025_9BACE|nr:glycosyltransferase family 2 protein [Bacteroides stercorirosoris]RGX76718.1 glycosyltransferase [Bacteroides stercorirosoris]
MIVSIITIAFNSAQTIRDTLTSVLSQSYSNIEYIIIDGASNDATVRIVKEYEPMFNGRLKWVSEPDKGLYDAMNKGIKMATGDVIGILNSDDLFYDSNVLRDIALAFDENTDALFGNLYFVKSDDVHCIVRAWKGSTYSSFKKGWHPAHPTFYVRREVYEKYGGFDTSFDVSADFELMLRFVEKNRIRTKYLDRYMVKMRMGGESTRNIANIIKGNRNIIRAFRKNDIQVSWAYPIYRLFPKVVSLLRYKLGLKSANL